MPSNSRTALYAPGRGSSGRKAAGQWWTENSRQIAVRADGDERAIQPLTG